MSAEGLPGEGGVEAELAAEAWPEAGDADLLVDAGIVDQVERAAAVTLQTLLQSPNINTLQHFHSH